MGEKIMAETYEEKTTVFTEGSPGIARTREGAEEFAEEARRKGKSFIEEQKTTAANSLGSIASALHDTCSRLESEQPSTARLFGQGAEALDRLANTLNQHDAEGLMRQAQDLARRQPALMLGGAVAAGFLLSRMLKSTSHRSEFEYQSGRDIFESAKESVQSRFGEEHEREKGDAGIILSPNEPVQEEITRDPVTGEELPRKSFLTPEEERHATD
jgi:hypothetical protein